MSGLATIDARDVTRNITKSRTPPTSIRIQVAHFVVMSITAYVATTATLTQGNRHRARGEALQSSEHEDEPEDIPMRIVTG